MGLGLKTRYFRILEQTLGERTRRLGMEAKQHFLERFDRSQIQAKPQSQKLLTTIIGEGSLQELELSLLSLYLSSASLPAILVHTDLRSSPERIEKALAWWPGRLTVRAPTQVLEDAKGIDASLPPFAQAHRHGLKFCACITAANESPVIYTDSDVLWFADWTRLADSADDSPLLRLSQDTIRNYSPQLQDFWRPYTKCPPLNSGVMRLGGKITSVCDLTEAIQAATRDPDEFFAEQTLFAIACHRAGTPNWPMKSVHISRRGYWFAQGFRHPATTIIRHYPGRIRALFWIDGLRLAAKNGFLRS